MLHYLLYPLSRLPFAVLYFLSDWLLYPLVYYVVRYRRGLVRRQLMDCFPEKSEQERLQITRRFYHFFCDYIVETLKMQTMSLDEMRRRVTFSGIDEMLATLEREGKQFGFCFLGHYGNWEWMASYSLWLHEPWQGAQIYHPLRNTQFDEYFLQLRTRFRGTCIPMKLTMRQILSDRRDGKHTIVGFISDQGPRWQGVHHWIPFLNHPTAFLTGAERIAQQVDAALLYLHVTRPRRGYYHTKVEILSLNPKDEKGAKDFSLTDRYARLLEAQIRECPELWLWTHNRWKRSFEEWQYLKANNKI